MAKDTKKTGAATGTQPTNATSTEGNASTGAEGTAPKPAKPSKKGQLVQLGNRRRLGLALLGVLAELGAGTVNIDPEHQSPAIVEAHAALTANKYSALRSQSELMGEVQTRLQKAIEAGDGKLIASLGKAINRIKAGQSVDLDAIGRQPAALKAANDAEREASLTSGTGEQAAGQAATS